MYRSVSKNHAIQNKIMCIWINNDIYLTIASEYIYDNYICIFIIEIGSLRFFCINVRKYIWNLYCYIYLYMLFHAFHRSNLLIAGFPTWAL